MPCGHQGVFPAAWLLSQHDRIAQIPETGRREEWEAGQAPLSKWCRPFLSPSGISDPAPQSGAVDLTPVSLPTLRTATAPVRYLDDGRSYAYVFFTQSLGVGPH